MVNDESMQVVKFEPDPGDGDTVQAEAADFADLVRAHHRELLVYATALTREPATARDIVQDAFVVAYEKRGVFDVTRDFGSWMRGIVRNKWREWLRRNRRYDLGEPELARIDAAVAAWQSGRLHGESPLFAALEDCLAKLPEQLREAVAAYYYEGRSGDETAQHLGIAPAAVRKRLQRARILLKQCLEQKRPGLSALSPE
jgi:RNA polymerase sigma factor (sigma-70 family)